MELSDEKIMLSVKDGQLSELAELFERYHVKLYHFFLKLTLDKTASEDLVQNLFCRIIRYRHTYRPANGNFRTWIYQLARNIHVDFCRQQQKNRIHYMDEIHDHIPATEGGYSEEQFEKLDKALLQLQPDQREVIVLSRFGGMKYEEISRITNLSVAAVKTKVFRAMQQLRNLYFIQTQDSGNELQ